MTKSSDTNKVSKVIIISNGNILLIKRTDAPYNWDLPGGHAELGESIRDAACRETHEETNIFIEPKNLQYLSKIQLNNSINFYFAQLKPKNIQLSHEHSEFEWVNPKDLGNYKFFSPKIVNLIHKAFQLNEDFQKNVKKKHRPMIIRLIGKGDNKNTAPYTKKPSYKRSKSAPAGFGGS